jgi:hypothetical protein
MGLKKFTLFSILLILLIAGYVFSLESGDYMIEILDKGFVLPVAVWVILPVVFLFLASFAHIIFYGFKNYLSSRAIVKDEENLVELIRSNLLHKDELKTFKSKEFKEVGEILSQLRLNLKGVDFSSQNKYVNETVDKVLRINSGKYVSSKELKLPNDNVLMQKNLENKINIDDDFCLEVLKKSSVYPAQIVKKAFMQIVKNKSMTTIKKQLENITFDKEMVKALFKKDSHQQEEFALTNNEIIKYIKSADFSRLEFIELAKLYKNRMVPDQLIKLFEDLSSENEEAAEAFLHVLFEYEMLDNVREILANSSKTEYLPYKALLDLKDTGKHYTLDSISYK